MGQGDTVKDILDDINIAYDHIHCMNEPGRIHDNPSRALIIDDLNLLPSHFTTDINNLYKNNLINLPVIVILESHMGDDVKVRHFLRLNSKRVINYTFYNHDVAEMKHYLSSSGSNFNPYNLRDVNPECLLQYSMLGYNPNNSDDLKYIKDGCSDYIPLSTYDNLAQFVTSGNGITNWEQTYFTPIT